MALTATVKTQIFIISDTHGLEFDENTKPTHRADIAIHCGDLTESSTLEELRATLRLLHDIDAPLKLVIAGNHDFSLDPPALDSKISEARRFNPDITDELVIREFGRPGEAKQVLDDARGDGVVFLEEGHHSFTLANGAKLSVFASSYTPSVNDWAFQYDPAAGHEFNIPRNTDVVITHGPPQGIMDYDSTSHRRLGCPDLCTAVAKARPRLHCFGHVHEGWGAKVVHWKDPIHDRPSHFNSIDNDKSVVVEKFANLQPSALDDDIVFSEKRQRMARYKEQKCVRSHHSAGDKDAICPGQSTLFVNAAFKGTDMCPTQPPWLLTMDLPAA